MKKKCTKHLLYKSMIRNYINAINQFTGKAITHLTFNFDYSFPVKYPNYNKMSIVYSV